ncbi:helix-turn-helix transcriptional regulator [Microbacterium esteraromaticum]|uniref:helix-turn-helix transcriptional regulator n=1 Tax=Microbacterium esteraromaticum TaxID=57043 RepID=UPI0019D34AAF|nr:hypothetical protein [Microbacterium esteraromaticum]MBN7792444.1 hypothetical protein [Microbacterium esteraromaticum]
MENYALCVVVNGFDLDDEFQNAGLECLSYDAIVSRTGGVTRIDADVPALSALDALMQLIADLRSINVTVVRVDPDLVDVSEIAERLGVTRESARLWSTGARRKDFPQHYAVVGATRVWFWADVHEWALQNRIAAGDAPLASNAVEALNGAMAHSRSKHLEGWLTPAVAPVAHIAQRQTRHPQGWQSVPAQAVPA